jgi:hypothetical protein
MSQANRVLPKTPLVVDGGYWFIPSTSIHFATSPLIEQW